MAFSSSFRSEALIISLESQWLQCYADNFSNSHNASVIHLLLGGIMLQTDKKFGGRKSED